LLRDARASAAAAGPTLTGIEFMRATRILISFIACLVSLHAAPSRAENPAYHINAGDVLLVFVWNEKDLSQEVLVRPDGLISLPLAGQIQAGGLGVDEVEKNITAALTKYMKDQPSVTVAVKETRGYSIFVLGKVNRPGQFMINQRTDIMQALALAGGLNSFAAENNINVLRREKDGSQKSLRFRYSDVKAGENLQTNIPLESGDIVVVP
jgi:polysaccharide export outer membrane protein